MIAEAVNEAHPGKGLFRQIDADHGFAQATGFKESFGRIPAASRRQG